MGKKLQLHIPLPCHEDWDNMTTVDKGKFCASCQKAVIDFTYMSDEEIITYFKKPPTGSVCGRFQEHQLNRNIQMPQKTLPWIKYFFQFALPAFLISMKADAQKQKLTRKVAAVYISETKRDIKFTVPDTIPAVTSVQTVMMLQQSVQIHVGGVVAGITISSNRKKVIQNDSIITCFIKNLKDTIIAPFVKFSVYPNPIISGQSITIANNKLTEDNYDIEIINLTGQVVHKEYIQINDKQKINLETPLVAAGAYFLKLTGQKSLKTYSEKIIIQ